MFSLLYKFLIDFLVRNRSSKNLFQLFSRPFLAFSLYFRFVSVDADSGGPRLEHCQFWLISRSILEEFETVVHFLTPPWWPNGDASLGMCTTDEAVSFFFLRHFD